MPLDGPPRNELLRRMCVCSSDHDVRRGPVRRLSGADIKAVCTEAGLLALRERRMKVTQDDFVKAKEKALYQKKGNIPEGLYI